MFGQGFLGGAGPFGADLNLLVQSMVGVALLTGAGLARLRWYRAHGVCQALAYTATVAMAALWMVPAFREIFAPQVARGPIDRLGLVVTLHASLGTGVLVLGAYVILVATGLLPARLAFTNYRRWMRALLALWWLVLLGGVLTYRTAW